MVEHVRPTTMLYKFPGPIQLQDGWYNTLVVEDRDIEDALMNGWYLTMPEAKGNPVIEDDVDKAAAMRGPTYRDNLGDRDAQDREAMALHREREDAKKRALDGQAPQPGDDEKLRALGLAPQGTADPDGEAQLRAKATAEEAERLRDARARANDHRADRTDGRTDAQRVEAQQTDVHSANRTDGRTGTDAQRAGDVRAGDGQDGRGVNRSGTAPARRR